ncbi:MAG: hypothetical protein V3U76_20345 [Granulosicoccus sp.]
MKLIYPLQRNAWFVEADNAWYRITDDAQVNIALTALPLHAVDEFQQAEQAHHAGTATVNMTNENTVTVSLFEPDGQPVDTLSVLLDEHSLTRVDWLTGKYRDGWVNASCRLQLDGLQQFELHGYLPPATGSDGKILTICNEAEGTTTEVFLKRNQCNVIPLLRDSSIDSQTLILECEPEATDSNADARLLGFVLIDKPAEAA